MAAAAAAAAAGPWAPAPTSVADWNAAAEPDNEMEIPQLRAGEWSGSSVAAPAAQRVWSGPADAALDAPQELPQQFAGLLRLGGIASPSQQDRDAAQRESTTSPSQEDSSAAQQEASTHEEWNAFGGADARCRRAFPCPADAPRPALVKGLAVCGCRGHGGNLRRGVAWFDAAGVLSFVSLDPC